MITIIIIIVVVVVIIKMHVLLYDLLGLCFVCSSWVGTDAIKINYNLVFKMIIDALNGMLNVL